MSDSSSLPESSPTDLFNKYTFFYLVHGKAISEYSSSMNIFIRHFCLKKLYELSTEHPELAKEVNKFFSVIQMQPKVKDIATNFNVDKYISFEEYINFMEKVFETAEELFKHNIMTYDFENYLQIICAYRLIVDVCELVVEWQQIDEKIQQLRNFCKFRIVQIVRMKENEVNRVKSSEELEYMKLEEEIRREKELEKERQEKLMEDELTQLEIRHSQTLEQREKQQQMQQQQYQQPQQQMQQQLYDINKMGNHMHYEQQMNRNIQPTIPNTNTNAKMANTSFNTTINRNTQTNINTNINPFGPYTNTNINNNNNRDVLMTVQKQQPSKYETLNNKYKQMIENNEQKAKQRSEERMRKIEEHQKQLQKQREEQRRAREEQKIKQNENKQQFHNPFQDEQSSLIKSQVLRKTRTSMETSNFNFPQRQHHQQQKPIIQNTLVNNVKPNNNSNPLSISIHPTSSIKLTNQDINAPFENINQINHNTTPYKNEEVIDDPFGSCLNSYNDVFENKKEQAISNSNNQCGFKVQMSDINNNNPFKSNDQTSQVNKALKKNSILNPYEHNSNPFGQNEFPNPFGDDNNNNKQLTNPFEDDNKLSNRNNNKNIVTDPFGDINNNNSVVADPFGDSSIQLGNPFEDINNNNKQSKNPFGDDFPQGSNFSNQQNIFDDLEFPKGEINSNLSNIFNPFNTPNQNNTNNNNINPIQKRETSSNSNPSLAPKIIPTKKYVESPPPKNAYLNQKNQILTHLLPQLTASLHQDNLTESLEKCTNILSILSKYNKQIN